MISFPFIISDCLAVNGQLNCLNALGSGSNASISSAPGIINLNFYDYFLRSAATSTFPHYTRELALPQRPYLY